MSSEAIRIIRVKASDVADTVNTIRRSIEMSQEHITMVKSIIDDVRRRGDYALIEYSKRFDDSTLSKDRIMVSREDISDAYKKVSSREVEALNEMKSRIEYVEHALLDAIKRSIDLSYKGVRIVREIEPLDSVGCYVPGGKARYPSTVLMTVLPAKIAGVKRVVVCTPPLHGSDVDPLTLVAADIAGADEVYRVGGVHAIAAMAYGTESIRSVSKIVGPAGMLVSTAKILVSNRVAIDMYAGPTELLVVADDTADPRLIALDIIAQAEHSSDTLCGLVTCSEQMAYATAMELSSLLSRITTRYDIVRSSIGNNGFIAVTDDYDTLLMFVNEFAPEHLQLHINDHTIASKIDNAGMILVGEHSSSAASDYCTGTNHVLPTSGLAKARGSLTCLDYLKIVSRVELSKEGLEDIVEHIGHIAKAEGLENHYRAVVGRFKKN
jgi:histidinol dehydrogenase